MISTGPLITATARGAHQIGAVKRQRASVMVLLMVGEIARLRDAATLAVLPPGNREVLPVAQASNLQVRQKGIIQLRTARIVLGLDIGPNSVVIREIKLRIRGNRTGRVGKTVLAPVIKVHTLRTNWIYRLQVGVARQAQVQFTPPLEPSDQQRLG